MAIVRTPDRDGRGGIDADLVDRLVRTQFPQWAHLAVTPVDVDGWDNRTYRLGEALAVRLPTAASYAAAVEKEHRWLPLLATGLPVVIPESLAVGAPGEGYPFPWSVRRWIVGETARVDRLADLPTFARAVADVLVALYRIDPAGGPVAGAHCFHRGAPLIHYDNETRRCLAVLQGRIDTAGAARVWDAALAASMSRPPVWFHGDVATGNLLVRDGALAAVIDFGTCGVGDPACDLVIAWTFFFGSSRDAFRRRVDQDDATWARARGWALWKALIGLADPYTAHPEYDRVNRQVVDDVLGEHVG